MFKRKVIQLAAFALLFFLPAALSAVVRTVKISNNAGSDAIDTLTLSGSPSFSRNASAPDEDVVFITNMGEAPVVVRNRIVTNGGSLVSYSITPGVNADEFVVDTDPSGGPIFIYLNGAEITDDVEGYKYSNGGQRFELVDTPPIPIFDGYGLAVFGALLLASLVWFVRRRKRLAGTSV